MKPSTDQLIRHEGNVGTNRRAMTIDLDSLPMMMDRLTDLYTDQVGAVIREYPANAWDSHQIAGNPDPIEVTLPTQQEPTFVVTDRGTGMSIDDVLDNLSRYGWSSKRDNNVENGMMGLGFKAALTYTSQFTLVTVKDGIEATVLISRGDGGTTEDERNLNGVEVMDTVGTDEPNGVSVYIPVSDVRTFREKATVFFRHWEKGSVLVDGEEPEPLKGSWIDEGVLLQGYDDVPGWGNPNSNIDIIVMGNIPYPVDMSVEPISKEIEGARAIVFVPIGSVDPATNREGLVYNDRTRATCRTARDFIQERVRVVAQNEIDAADTPAEAVELSHTWMTFLDGYQYAWKRNRPRNFSYFTYRGHAIPFMVKTPQGWRYHPLDDVAGRTEVSQLTLIEAIGQHCIVGHPTKTLSRRQRNLIRGLVEEDENMLPYRHIHVVADLDERTRFWLKDENVHPWDEVEAATPLPPDGQPINIRSSSKQTYEIRVGGKRRWVDEAPNTSRTIYTSPADYKDDKKRHAIAFFTQTIKPNYTVVFIHPRSFSRFSREHPRTLSMQQAIKKELKALYRRLTPLERGMIATQRDTLPLELTELDPTEILDEEMKELITTLRKGVKDLRRMNDFLHRAAADYKVRDLPTLDGAKSEEIKSILDRYPLVRHLHWGVPEGTVRDYINALYLMNLEESTT